MKYILIIVLVVLFGYFGYSKKQKIIIQYKFINFLKDYISFYDSNISVFKNDLIKINQDYIIMQNNKSAIKEFIIIKNANKYEFDIDYLENTLLYSSEKMLLKKYFQTIGKSEYNDEKLKNKEIIIILNELSKKIEIDIKQKGDLGFKLMLAIGAVISIILW